MIDKNKAYKNVTAERKRRESRRELEELIIKMEGSLINFEKSGYRSTKAYVNKRIKEFWK